MGRLWLGVRVSASVQKNARLVARLVSGPRLVADRANVVLAIRVNQPCPPAIGPCRPTDTVDVVFIHTLLQTS